jgi:exopolysaccharide production protein ExoZ
MTLHQWLTDRFEVSRGLGGHNVRPMEGLRGFAVFLVFLVHYVSLIRPWIDGDPVMSSIATAIHTIGNTGVDLFFVLSGYLIYGSLISRAQPFAKFIWRRIQRIYPAFIAVFVLYIILSFVFPSQNKIPADAVEGLSYLAANFLLLPGIFPIEPMITVAWSLSYEMTFYFVIPLLILAFGLRGRSSGWRIAFFGLAAIGVVLACLGGGPVQLILFIAGIALYEVINAFATRAPRSGWVIVALALGLSGTLLPLQGPVGFTVRTLILCVAFFVICFTCFRRPDAVISRGFSWTPMRWLGNMSYSYYLLHGLSLKGYFLVLGLVLATGGNSSVYFWTLLPVMFMLSLIPPAVLFLAVERPFSLVKTKKKAIETPQAIQVDQPISSTT